MSTSGVAAANPMFIGTCKYCAAKFWMKNSTHIVCPGCVERGMRILDAHINEPGFSERQHEKFTLGVMFTVGQIRKQELKVDKKRFDPRCPKCKGGIYVTEEGAWCPKCSEKPLGDLYWTVWSDLGQMKEYWISSSLPSDEVISDVVEPLLEAIGFDRNRLRWENYTDQIHGYISYKKKDSEELQWKRVINIVYC